MTPALPDHLFAVVLVTVVPALGVWKLRRLNERLAAGEADARLGVYRGVLWEELLLVAAVLGLWWAAGRPWAALVPEAPTAPGWLPWAGWGAAAALSVLLVVQARALLGDPEELEDARDQIAPLEPILPHTEREHASFRLLAVAAGVGEEILYRGFAFAWFVALASGPWGLGPWPALGVGALGSSLMFGLGHAYQGAAGMVKTGAVGLVLAALAVATGGLWAPMAVHTAVDLTSGRLAYAVLGEGAEEPSGRG